MVSDFQSVATSDLNTLAAQYLDPAAIREIHILPVP
jgi:hypothetical protein